MTEENAVAPQEAVTEEDNPTQGQETEAPGAEQDSPTVASDEGGIDVSEQKTKTRHQRRKEAMERMAAEKADLERKLAESEAKRKQLEDPDSVGKKPVEGNFASYEDYQAALSAWHAMSAMDDRQRKQTEKEVEARKLEIKRAAEREQQAVQEAWAEQVAEAKKRYADFDEVIQRPDVPISTEVAQIVARMDSGTDVAYYLCQNPDEARRISGLPPVQAALELGRLEARLSLPKARTVTKAPDPLSPVTPKATVASDPQKMSAAEYRVWRESGGTI